MHFEPGVFGEINTDEGFEDSYNPDDEEASKNEDTQRLKTIIKSQTSEDVFEQFAQWYIDNRSAKSEEFMADMESVE